MAVILTQTAWKAQFNSWDNQKPYNKTKNPLFLVGISVLIIFLIPLISLETVKLLYYFNRFSIYFARSHVC